MLLDMSGMNILPHFSNQMQKHWLVLTREGNKAEYVVAMKEYLNDTWVEENTLTATNDNTIFIVDAMAFVHQNQDYGCSSFSDLQQRLLKKLLSVCPTQCTCVNVVEDRYDFESTKSLKYEERIRRRQQRAVIQATYTDTDIFIMAIYLQKGFSYIPCHIMANLLDEMFTLSVTLASSALLCVHIMSGCDTVTVYGKGKKKSFKVTKANASDLT